MGQGECNCACPVGSGPKKTLADISGTYEASKMRCCKAKICGCPAKNCDFGCVCFHCGPVPFSGTPVCKIGDNVWANYQVNFCASTTPRITNLLTTRACVCDTGRATASPRRRMGSSSRTTSAASPLLPRSAARPRRRSRWSARSSSARGSHFYRRGARDGPLLSR